MKWLFILLIILKGYSSSAQESSTLQGKWKIISVTRVISTSNDSLYYDLVNDSIYIPAEDLSEAYKDGLDSIRTVDLFKSMYGSLKSSTFTFVNDSVILELNATKAIGTFQLKGNNTLNMHLLFNGREKVHLNCNYLFTGKLLHVLLAQDSGYLKYVLKKE